MSDNINLPEPQFIETNPEIIEQEWIQSYEEKSGKTLYPAQPERLICETGAYQESLTRTKMQEVAKSLLLAYAQYPVIDYIGELVGVTRLTAQKATTTIRYSLSEILAFDVSIPAGSIVNSTDGKVSFSTIENATITVGNLYIDVEAECTIEGEIVNGYLSGQINVMDEPIANISSAANITTSAGGADEESTDNYRERIRLAPETFSNAGSKGGYRFWAMSVNQNIVDVAVTSPTAGTVNVYPLTKTGNPSQGILDAVEAAINAETVRPLTDLVNVLSPTKVDFEITATIELQENADEETTIANVISNLDIYTENQKKSLKKEVKISEIISIIFNTAGVANLDLTSPEADIVPEINEWVNCTDKNITSE